MWLLQSSLSGASWCVWMSFFKKEMYQVTYWNWFSKILIWLSPNCISTLYHFTMDEILFEKFQFQTVMRLNAGVLSSCRFFWHNIWIMLYAYSTDARSFIDIFHFYIKRKRKKLTSYPNKCVRKTLSQSLKEDHFPQATTNYSEKQD